MKNKNFDALGCCLRRDKFLLIVDYGVKVAFVLHLHNS